MFPLILTVIIIGGYFNPYEGLLVYGGTSQGLGLRTPKRKKS